MRDGFVFYSSFWDAIKGLEPDEFKKAITALMEYGLNGNEVVDSPIALMALTFAKPQIDKNNQRYENGKKGGRSVTKAEPNDNQTITKAEPNHEISEPKDKDKVKDKVKDKEKIYKKEISRFQPPTLEEVSSYCSERNKGVDPNKFIDFYQSKGWMVGKNKMKDWKAAVRTWERKSLKASDYEEVLPDWMKPREEEYPEWWTEEMIADFKSMQRSH